MEDAPATTVEALRPTAKIGRRAEQSRVRLGLFASVIGSLFVLLTILAFLFFFLVEPPEVFEEARTIRTIIALAVSLLSLAMVWAVRNSSLETRLVNNLGLTYQALLVFLSGLARFSLPREADYIAYGVSFSGVVILLFPLMVNNSVKRTIGGAFTAALMEPVALTLATAFGNPWPEPSSAASLLLPTFLCAGLAGIPALIVSRLEHDVAELGSYRLGRSIGSGGMGEVWRAEHKMLARPAAIKIVRSQHLGEPDKLEKNLDRFQREAQATALLMSPHTIDLFDFGTTDDGRFYYVMELLDGVDLHRLITQFGPVPAERAVFFLEQVCDSLIDAHGVGLIHRDIKPANIFTCRYGHRVDFVKVLDFGLVKPQGESSQELLSRSDEQMTVGTPAFLAPEVAMGSVLPDPQLDLYGVGCVAYWLVTGQPVFEGKTPMDLALQHMQEEVVPPSKRTELAIPAPLEKTILQCLEKKPGERPESAEAVLRTLRETGLAATWTEERALQWWHQHLPEGTTTARFEGEHPVQLMRTRRRSTAPPP